MPNYDVPRTSSREPRLPPGLQQLEIDPGEQPPPRQDLTSQIESLLTLFKRICAEIGAAGLARFINLVVYLVLEYKVASTDEVTAALLQLLTIIGAYIGVSGAILGTISGELKNAIEKAENEEIKTAFVRSHIVALVLSLLLSVIKASYVFGFPLRDPEAQEMATRILYVGPPAYTGVILAMTQFNAAISFNRGPRLALVTFLSTFILLGAFVGFRNESPYDRLLGADALMLGAMFFGNLRFVFPREVSMALTQSKYWKKAFSTLLSTLKLGLDGAFPALSQLLATLLTLYLVEGDDKTALLYMGFLGGIFSTHGATALSAALNLTIEFAKQYPNHPNLAKKTIALMHYLLNLMIGSLPLLAPALPLFFPKDFVSILHGDALSPDLQQKMVDNSYYSFATIIFQIVALGFQGQVIALQGRGPLNKRLNNLVTALLTIGPLLAVLLGFVFDQNGQKSQAAGYLEGGMIAWFLTAVTTAMTAYRSTEGLGRSVAQVGMFGGGRAAERVVGPGTATVELVPDLEAADGGGSVPGQSRP